MLMRDSAKTSNEPVDGQGMKAAPMNPIAEREVKIAPSLIFLWEINAMPKAKIEKPARIKNSRETNR